jgi:hypothetical protein
MENFDDELKQLTTMVPAWVMLAQPRGTLSDLNGRKPMVQIEDKSRYDKLEPENAALRNQVGQLTASAEFHKKKHQEQWNRGRSRENSRNGEHTSSTGSPPRKKVTVPDRASQPYQTPTATAKVKMLRTSYPDSGSEDSQMVDHEEPGRARANLVRIPLKDAAQVETAEEEVPEYPSITIDTGGEQSTDLVSNSADMIAWKKSEPKSEDITSDMHMPIITW